jgi:hypothetical protein
VYISQGDLNNGYNAPRMPSAALDPNSPGTVYVAFVGSVTSDGLTKDLYVARGTTDSGTGVLSFTPGDTVRITDVMLRPGGVDEGETNEFMPSICVDKNGGINLLYCREQADIDDTETISVRYARWASWSSLAAGNAGSVTSFTPNFPGRINTGNDYQMICNAGCKLYAAYASQETGVWNIYVRVITLDSCGDADTDGSGDVTTNDFATFNTAYMGNDPLADRNLDGSVNATDANQFLTAYSQSQP